MEEGQQDSELIGGIPKDDATVENTAKRKRVTLLDNVVVAPPRKSVVARLKPSHAQPAATAAINGGNSTQLKTKKKGKRSKKASTKKDQLSFARRVAELDKYIQRIWPLQRATNSPKVGNLG